MIEVDPKLTQTPTTEADREVVANFRSNYPERWATTFAKFAPHWYVHRSSIRKGDYLKFLAMARIIQTKGVDVHVFKRVYRYYYCDGYAYWCGNRNKPWAQVGIVNFCLAELGDDLGEMKKKTLKVWNKK